MPAVAQSLPGSTSLPPIHSLSPTTCCKSRDCRGRIRDSKWHVLGMALIAVVFDAMGMYRTALSLHSRASTLAEQVADQSTLAQTTFYRAMHCHAAGRWREGLPYYDRAKTLSWEIGEIRLWAALTANLVQHLTHSVSQAGLASRNKFSTLPSRRQTIKRKPGHCR